MHAVTVLLTLCNSVRSLMLASKEAMTMTDLIMGYRLLLSLICLGSDFDGFLECHVVARNGNRRLVIKLCLQSGKNLITSINGVLHTQASAHHSHNYPQPNFHQSHWSCNPPTPSTTPRRSEHPTPTTPRSQSYSSHCAHPDAQLPLLIIINRLTSSAVYHHHCYYQHSSSDI